MTRRSWWEVAPVLTRPSLDLFRRLPRSVRRLLTRAITPNYTLGAVAVIRDDDGRVMLLRTRQHVGWSLPGGLLRRGETPLVGLARELAEEIDIAIAPAALEQLPQHTLIEPGTQQVTVVVELELAAEPSPDGVEVLEIGWFTLDAIPSRIVRQTFDLLRAAGIDIPSEIG